MPVGFHHPALATAVARGLQHRSGGNGDAQPAHPSRQTTRAAGSAATAVVPPTFPPRMCAIELPVDHYQHLGAPTEWWWHIGTLRSTDGRRTFGFEINGASWAGQGGFAFTQVMVTDVEAQRHLQRTAVFAPPMFDPAGWAESNAAKDWSVSLGEKSGFAALDIVAAGSGYPDGEPLLVEFSGGGGALAAGWAIASGGAITETMLFSRGMGYTSEPTAAILSPSGSGAQLRAIPSYVVMSGPASDPMQNMHVEALAVDEATKDVVTFDLHMSQAGPPFIVWGTGTTNAAGGGLQNSNYYYSLTRLETTGTLTIGGEQIAVAGTTWMDHEYGAFTHDGKRVSWILQDMQLDNGVCISNYFVPSAEVPHLKVGVPAQSAATVQRRDGVTYCVTTTLTPTGPTWTSPVTNQTYFTEFSVQFTDFGNAQFTVRSLVDAQEFTYGPVYEGIASVTGTFEGHPVSGDAWNEQAPP